MKEHKEHLNYDLGFLDEAKSSKEKIKAASAYKMNWRNIITIGALVIAFFCWIALSDKFSINRSHPNTHQTPVSNDAGTVKNGHYNCSREDSHHIDLMMPTNKFKLAQEEMELKQRREALNALKQQIDMSHVNQYPDQESIDRYNAMVSRYNAQLTELKSGYAVYQTRIDNYNQQVQARNKYLDTHCRRSQ